jgi:hypothetical protein
MLHKALISTAAGAAALGLSSVAASAAIVCSGNVCWHTSERLSYPAESRVIIHRDNWRWGPRDHFTWREHEGRGYWRGDSWTEF